MNENEKKEEESAKAKALLSTHSNEFKRLMEQNFQQAQDMVKEYNQKGAYYFASFAFNPKTKACEIHGTLPHEQMADFVIKICVELKQGMTEQYKQSKSLNLHGETKEITKPDIS